MPAGADRLAVRNVLLNLLFCLLFLGPYIYPYSAFPEKPQRLSLRVFTCYAIFAVLWQHLHVKRSNTVDCKLRTQMLKKFQRLRSFCEYAFLNILHGLHECLTAQGYSVIDNANLGGYIINHYSKLFGERFEDLMMELR